MKRGGEKKMGEIRANDGIKQAMNETNFNLSLCLLFK